MPQNLDDSLALINDAGLATILVAIARSAVDVAAALRVSVPTKMNSPGAANNAFGDEVLSVDIIADKVICRHLASTPAVAAYSSEEHPELHVLEDHVQSGSGAYTVTFDPLDGSSIIDTNFSVGSIFGIWNGSSVIGQKIKDSMSASVMVVYGPRTTMFIGHPEIGGVRQYLLLDDGQWFDIHPEGYTVAPEAQIFSPGNLRATNVLPGYDQFVSGLVKRNTTLRYTGGMVPDVAQILVKGSGIFTTPVGQGFKVKLRVCFECGPIAHLMSLAGAAATDGSAEAKPYLDHVVGAMDERSGFVVGSRDTVRSTTD
jgi:sedoheptulose-bisphosphatase